MDAAAAGLLALGVRPGDRVGVWGPSVPEWLLLQFATARVGAIQVNVNPSYRAHELEFVLNKVSTLVVSAFALPVLTVYLYKWFLRTVYSRVKVLEVDFSLKIELYSKV